MATMGVPRVCVLALLLACLSAAGAVPALNLGVGRMDEISGVTRPWVYSPFVHSEDVVADGIAAGTVDANHESVSLSASGGINFSAASVEVESGESIVLAGSGRLTEIDVRATTVHGESATFRSAYQQSITSDGTVSVNNPLGNVLFTGDVTSRIDGVSDTTVSSTFGDVLVASTRTRLHALDIGVDAGDKVDDESAHVSAGRDVTVHTSGEFSTDSRGTVDIWAERSAQFSSDDAFMTLESGDVFTITSTSSDVDFIAQQDFAIRSILGDIELESDNVINFNGFTVETTAASIDFDATEVNVDSRGPLKIIAANEISFEYNELDIFGDDSLKIASAEKLTLDTNSTSLTAPVITVDADFDFAPVVIDANVFQASSEVVVDVIASNIYATANKTTLDGERIFMLVGDRQQEGVDTYYDGTMLFLHEIATFDVKETLSYGGNDVWLLTDTLDVTARRTEVTGFQTIDLSVADPSKSIQVNTANFEMHTGWNAEQAAVINQHISTEVFAAFANNTAFVGSNNVLVHVAPAIPGDGDLVLDSFGDLRIVGSAFRGIGEYEATGGEFRVDVGPESNGTDFASVLLSAERTPADGVFITLTEDGSEGLFNLTETVNIDIVGGWVEWTNLPGTSVKSTVNIQATETASITAGRDIHLSGEHSMSLLSLSAKNLTRFEAFVTDHYVNGRTVSMDIGNFEESDGTALFNTTGDQLMRSGSSIEMSTEKFFGHGGSLSMLADDKPEDSIHLLANTTSVTADDLYVAGGGMRIFVDQDASVEGSSVEYVARYDYETSAFAASFDAEDSFALYAGGDFEVDTNGTVDFVQLGTAQDDFLTLSASKVGENLYANALGNMTISALSDMRFDADNMLVSAQDTLDVFSDTIDFTASSLIEFLGDSALSASAAEIALATAGTISVTGDLTLSTLNELDIKACKEDITMRGREFLVSTPRNLYVLQKEVCDRQFNTTGFHVGIEADDGRAEISAEHVWFNATGGLLVKGGEVSIESRVVDDEDGNIDLLSPNGVSLNSVGGASEVDHGAREDRFFAPIGSISYFAERAVQMYSHGRDDNGGFQDYGMLFDTTGENDFVVAVPAGSFIGNSLEGLRVVTASDDVEAIEPQDVHIEAARDVYIETLDGTFEMVAGGSLDETTENLEDTGVGLYAWVGDVLVEAHEASIGVSGFRGVQLLSLDGGIEFTAGGDVTHRATIVDESLIRYYSTDANILVSAAEDITLGAGSDANLGDIQIIALDTLDVVTGQTQRYHQNGPSTAINQDGVEIVSTFGDILVDAGDDLQFSASGHATFDAKVKEMLISVGGDAYFVSDGSRVNVVSARSLLLDSLFGDVNIAASGGGGEVNVISDSSQDLALVADRDMIHIARGQAYLLANSDISGTAERGSMSFETASDALVHSSGKVVLESTGVRTAPVDGVNVAGESLNVRVGGDMTIDGNFVTVGRVSSVSSASDPFVSIFAGGDDTAPGSVVESNGNVRLASLADGADVGLFGRFVDVAAQNTITFDSNGPIAFATTGADDAGELVVDAFAGNMEVNAQQAVEFYGYDEMVVTTNGNMILETTSRLGENGVYVRSHQDFTVEAALLWDWQVSEEARMEMVDMLVRADNAFQLRNRPGFRGTLEFDSDNFLTLEAGGDMLFETSGDSPIVSVSRGEQSDITIAARDVRDGAGASLNINSGSSITMQGEDVDMDGRTSVLFRAPSAGAVIEATDELIIQVNDTLTLSSFKVLTMDVVGELQAVAEGEFVVNAAEDVRMATQLQKADFSVEADGDLHVFNFLNPTPSQRGDMRLESDGDATISTNFGDTTLLAGEDFRIRHGNGFVFNGAAGLHVLATDPTGGTTYVKTQDDALMVARDEIRWSGGTAGNETFPFGSLSVLVESFELDTGSNGVGELFEIYAGDDARFIASNGVVELSSLVAVEMRSRNDTTVTADLVSVLATAEGGDILFDSLGDMGVSLSGQSGQFLIATHAATDPSADEGSLRIQAPGNMTFASQGEFTAQAEDMRIAGGALIDIFASEEFDVSGATFVNIVAGGRDSPADTGYGVLIESQQATTMTAVDAVLLHSGAGAVSLAASEKTTVLASAYAEFIASNVLRVSSGFDATPMSPFEEVVGVELETAAGSSLEVVSMRDDIVTEGFDITVDGVNLVFDAKSDDHSSFRLHSEMDAEVLVNTALAVSSPTSRVRISAASSLDVLMSTSVQLTADTRVTLQTTATDGVIQFDSDEIAIALRGPRGITLDAPGSFVDFQRAPNDGQAGSPTGLDVNVLRIPALVKEAERNSWANSGLQNPELRFDELHVPGCLNRQLGVESLTGELCVCDRNKWRCTPPVGP